jgi:hypothetical protein
MYGKKSVGAKIQSDKDSDTLNGANITHCDREMSKSADEKTENRSTPPCIQTYL